MNLRTDEWSARCLGTMDTVVGIAEVWVIHPHGDPMSPVDQVTMFRSGQQWCAWTGDVGANSKARFELRAKLAELRNLAECKERSTKP